MGDEHWVGWGLRSGYLGEEQVEDLLVVAHVNASVQFLHLLLVLSHGVLKRITLDVQVLVLHVPGDRDASQTDDNKSFIVKWIK